MVLIEVLRNSKKNISVKYNRPLNCLLETKKKLYTSMTLLHSTNCNSVSNRKIK